MQYKKVSFLFSSHVFPEAPTFDPGNLLTFNHLLTRESGKHFSLLGFWLISYYFYKRSFKWLLSLSCVLFLLLHILGHTFITVIIFAFVPVCSITSPWLVHYTALKTESWYHTNLVVSSGTAVCPNGNLYRSHTWRQSWCHDDSVFNELVMCLERSVGFYPWVPFPNMV